MQTGADPRIGTAIAQILGQEMAAAGGITVLPIPQGVKRADFLENARATKADFYISGYVTPVGDTAAVVEQVVSVESGVILFLADGAGLERRRRGFAIASRSRADSSVRRTRNSERRTQTANTPAPTSTNGANVPISGIGTSSTRSSSIRDGAYASPGPVVKPSRGIIVASVDGFGIGRARRP